MKCHTVLPENARFCFICGALQPVKEPSAPRIVIDFQGDVERQLTDAFFKALRNRVEEELSSVHYARFYERIYESGFRDTLYLRVAQIRDLLFEKDRKRPLSSSSISDLVEGFFEDLLDYFVIHYCADLHEIHLPEAILRYQNIRWENTDLFQMVPDYLDFEHEQETVYTDFLKMPLEKLKNAGNSFLFPERQEKILLICDQSILGSCKEGFALTQRAIYWKTPLEKARMVAYEDLAEIKREKDWITINSNFFHVNRSVNLKMLKLLKKIKRLIRSASQNG